MNGQTGLYVYAVVAAADQGCGQGLTGVDGSLTRAVDHDGLAAVVSSVWPESLKRGVANASAGDLSALEAQVRSHERVLERLLAGQAVLPMRFGTVYPSQTDLVDMLRTNGPALRFALERLAAKTEWGLRVTWNEESVRSRLEAIDTDSSDGDAPGRAYLANRLRQRAIQAQLERLRLEQARRVHNRIAVFAAEARANKDARQRLDRDRRRQLVFRASYLVAREDEDRFRAIVEHELATSEFGLAGELTGPWPPFTFADQDTMSQDADR